MPLCFARLHVVDQYRATDRLSIAIPDSNPKMESRGSSGDWNVRNAEVFFIKESSAQADIFDETVFVTRCQAFRERQMLSFVGCVLSDLIREEEGAILEKISRHVDYLILDVSSLPVEFWGGYIRMIRRITRRVGISIRTACGIPSDVLAPWIAKAVCEVGLKGVVFIDGPSLIFSQVQDELEGHRFSGGAGKIFPVIRSARILDLEPFVIESKRGWCAGVCIQDGATDGRFDLWKCAYEMIGKGKSPRSMLHAFGERWIDLTLECLRLEEALRLDGNVAAHKGRVEELLAEAENTSIGTANADDLKAFVEPLLALANSKELGKNKFCNSIWFRSHT